MPVRCTLEIYVGDQCRQSNYVNNMMGKCSYQMFVRLQSKVCGEPCYCNVNKSISKYKKINLQTTAFNSCNPFSKLKWFSITNLRAVTVLLEKHLELSVSTLRPLFCKLLIGWISTPPPPLTTFHGDLVKKKDALGWSGPKANVKHKFENHTECVAPARLRLSCGSCTT